MGKVVVRLKSNDEAYFFGGLASYWIVYDYSSGSLYRYHVFILTASDPVRIGCELPLDDCKQLIRDYEMMFRKHPEIYLGERNAMLSARKMASNMFTVKCETVLNKYRITRPKMYRQGFSDKSARKGYYVVAETAVEAVKILREQMGWHFEELDVQLWNTAYTDEK